MRLKMQYIREWATLAEPVSAKDLHAAAQRLGLKAACIASRPPAYDPKTVHGGIFGDYILTYYIILLNYYNDVIC